MGLTRKAQTVSVGPREGGAIALPGNDVDALLRRADAIRAERARAIGQSLDRRTTLFGETVAEGSRAQQRLRLIQTRVIEATQPSDFDSLTPAEQKKIKDDTRIVVSDRGRTFVAVVGDTRAVDIDPATGSIIDIHDIPAVRVVREATRREAPVTESFVIPGVAKVIGITFEEDGDNREVSRAVMKRKDGSPYVSDGFVVGETGDDLKGVYTAERLVYNAVEHGVDVRFIRTKDVLGERDIILVDAGARTAEDKIHASDRIAEYQRGVHTLPDGETVIVLAVGGRGIIRIPGQEDGGIVSFSRITRPEQVGVRVEAEQSPRTSVVFPNVTVESQFRQLTLDRQRALLLAQGLITAEYDYVLHNGVDIVVATTKNTKARKGLGAVSEATATGVQHEVVAQMARTQAILSGKEVKDELTISERVMAFMRGQEGYRATGTDYATAMEAANAIVVKMERAIETGVVGSRGRRNRTELAQTFIAALPGADRAGRQAEIVALAGEVGEQMAGNRLTQFLELKRDKGEAWDHYLGRAAGLLSGIQGLDNGGVTALVKRVFGEEPLARVDANTAIAGLVRLLGDETVDRERALEYANDPRHADAVSSLLGLVDVHRRAPVEGPSTADLFMQTFAEIAATTDIIDGTVVLRSAAGIALREASPELYGALEQVVANKEAAQHVAFAEQIVDGELGTIGGAGFRRLRMRMNGARAAANGGAPVDQPTQAE